MLFFKKKNKDISIIKKFNGKCVNHVTRRIESEDGVREEIIGKQGRISYNNGKVSIICGTEDVFVCFDNSVHCNMLMSGNGATVEGNNEVNGKYDKLIVYFSKL